jgi:DNA-binding LytR/AlgR family response regulator
MIRYIIVDDDEMQAEMLRMQLKPISGFDCIGVCFNAFDAKKIIEELRPDLLILDIEMPELSGIQLAKSMKEVPAVIFVTSHLGYAVDAFEVEAVDYLVKPVATERLIRALDKAKTAINKRETMNLSAEDDSFFIRDKNAFVKIAYDDVLYIEVSGNFSMIHTAGNEVKIALVSLSKMETQLPSERFVRISRTIIVNKQHIKSVSFEEVLIGSETLAVGGKYAENVLNIVVGDNIVKRNG